jgi:bla regulator protein BlaR1
MIPESFVPLANHLWQSTLFAGLVLLLALSLRKNRAQMRYRLWLAASLKFLIPFSLLIGIGSQFRWRTAPAVPPALSSAIEQIGRPFAPPPMPALPAPVAPAASSVMPALMFAVWFGGSSIVLSIWCIRWRRIRTALRTASPLLVQATIRVMSSPTLLEPGVFGVFRPVLLLPDGIAERLTSPQLKAILAHELCHVRRRDNLISAIHMVVEAVFWFHPLAWWIGARLMEERERACDEDVLRQGNEPGAYAAGIVNVCKFYLESPLACASGVTGSDLKKRVQAILTDRNVPSLTLARKCLLTIAGILAVAGPIVIGILRAPQARAQAPAAALRFEVATIKPARSTAGRGGMIALPGGGLRMEGVTLKQLIAIAYGVRETQIAGGPNWMGPKYTSFSPSPSAPKAGTCHKRRPRLEPLHGIASSSALRRCWLSASNS